MFNEIHQSMISSWDLCAERFRRRYIDGEIIPPGIAARVGTGCHKGAEINHLQKINTGKDLPVSDIQDAARDGYMKSIQEGVFFAPDEANTAKKQLSEGLDDTVRLAKVYAESVAPLIIPIMAEKKLSVTIQGIELPIVGTLDVYTADKWLPDLKTASSKWAQDKADSSPQPTLYRELIKEETGFYPEKMSFEILVKNKTAVHQSIETTRDESDLEALKKRINLMLLMIEKGIFPPADPSGWSCSPKWCGFYFSCSYISFHRKHMPLKQAA